MNTQNVNTAAAESTETRFNGDKVLRALRRPLFVPGFPEINTAALRTELGFHIDSLTALNVNRAATAVEQINRVSPGVVIREDGATAPAHSVMESKNPVAGIVNDWVSRTPAAREKTLIIIQLNADRQAVNAGIHAALAQRGELGDREVTVPVLARIGGGRHDFSRIADWKAGQVVLENDRYLTVMAVDRGTDTVLRAPAATT